ncbi:MULTISPECIES: hypothetical protein [Trichocoleus]|uniref:DUF8166 domain-containing protein n=1 Tax=Trichocoleus desertorum GB2-A4 TaxID=2933944 RepID=A0ABV0JBZ8_9CYAN|nr:MULTISPECIES: hypothetical protein [unclassified Trichocoleus]MBD1860960.1 hypothetical protein [Trichocoleus sp. FACHB-46]MBD2119392.1 hypothetical protein [Trichocoleus sp. FACHB-262]
MQLGKVVKSNSHCDYVVQLNDEMGVQAPPSPEDYGFGCFVKLETEKRHWAVGLIYNSQLFNPNFLNSGPRLSSEPDPIFTPDLINETRVLLGTVLIGTMERQDDGLYGQHGIPSIVVPVNTPVYKMTESEIHCFHLSQEGRPQFRYYSHLLRAGGAFASQLTHQVLEALIKSDFFTGPDQRALQILCKELSWKNTMGAIR